MYYQKVKVKLEGDMKLALFGFHLASVPIVILPFCMLVWYFAGPEAAAHGIFDRWALIMAIMATIFAAAVYYRKLVRKCCQYELPRLEHL